MSVLFWGGAAKRLEVTSPRLRGEVGSRSDPGEGEPPRGTTITEFLEPAPHPNPLPVRTGRGRREGSPNPAQLSHFATLFPLALSFGTSLERIAAESLTPR